MTAVNTDCSIMGTSSHEWNPAQSRYTGLYSIVNRERLRTVVDGLRAEGGSTLYLPEASREVYDTLRSWGFARRAEAVEWGSTRVSKWVDTASPGGPGS